jgi:TRAP-type uncharacterized transport system substrate-binding protein
MLTNKQEVRMKVRRLLIMGFIVVVAMAFSQAAFAKSRIVFGGGPAGGTFQVVANGIQVYKPIKMAKDFKVQAQSSAGSVENLRKTNSGRQQMSTVYSGHVYLGRNGMMKNDTKKIHQRTGLRMALWCSCTARR